MPFFSIIIPSYNRAHIITETIVSVQKQSFSDWECIVVDDGSTDNTKEVIADILQQDLRIKYIYQKNAERSAARNNGIKNAKGKYICFLDSDDFYLENHLQVLRNEIVRRNEPKALFFTNQELIQNEKVWKGEFVKLDEKKTTEYLLTYPIIPARVCIHKDILNQYTFREDIVIVEDQVLWTTISMHYPIIQLSEYTVLYSLHEDNSVNIKNNCFTPRLKGLKLFFSQKWVQKGIPSTIRRKVISDCYFGIARYYSYINNYKLYVINLLLSIFYKPIHKQTKAKIHMLFFPSKHK